MEIKKSRVILVIIVLCGAICLIIGNIKQVDNYTVQTEIFKTATLEENSIGYAEGRILIQNYKDEYDVTITAYLSSDLQTIKEQIISDADGNYIIYFAEAGEYTISITKPGYLTYTCTEVIIANGQIIRLDDITLIPGDINENGEIEIMDLIALNDNFSNIINNSNKKYDLNNDGIINTEDREMIISNYKIKKSSVKSIYSIRLIADEPVAQIGNVTYTTLTDAINAVPTTGEETTILMLKSISGVAYLISSNKNVKLDLNGKKITNTANTINNYGILTTVDNNRIKGGIYSVGTDNNRAISNAGTLTINDITLNCNGYYGIYSTGDVNINSGTIIGSLQAGIGVAGPKTTNIKGGNIIGTTKYGVYAVSGAPTINLGNLDKEVGESPSVQGEISGVCIPKTSPVFNYYNGIIRGKTSSIDSQIIITPRTGYKINTQTEDEYEVSRLLLSDEV